MEFETGFPILGDGSSAAGTARVGARHIRQINMNPRASLMRCRLPPLLTVRTSKDACSVTELYLAHLCNTRGP
jgi:hypothetical protein